MTLQLHTAHILSAHATLDSKNKAVQDLKEQKNKYVQRFQIVSRKGSLAETPLDRLESERTRLLVCLREVNEDRDKVHLPGLSCVLVHSHVATLQTDMLEAKLKEECVCRIDAFTCVCLPVAMRTLG